jgi:hypothetical protein
MHASAVTFQQSGNCRRIYSSARLGVMDRRCVCHASRNSADARAVRSSPRARCQSCAVPVGRGRGASDSFVVRASPIRHDRWQRYESPNRIRSALARRDRSSLLVGRVTRMVIQANRAGAFRGQCAEYCGAQHSLMTFKVIAMPRAEFDAWLTRLAQPVHEPLTPELRQGHDLLTSLGCGECHTVRGIVESRRGPDLTQVGARSLIGAGALPGGIGNIAARIASSRHLKPGNAMQSYDGLEGSNCGHLPGTSSH